MKKNKAAAATAAVAVARRQRQRCAFAALQLAAEPARSSRSFSLSRGANAHTTQHKQKRAAVRAAAKSAAKKQVHKASERESERRRTEYKACVVCAIVRTWRVFCYCVLGNFMHNKSICSLNHKNQQSVQKAASAVESSSIYPGTVRPVYSPSETAAWAKIVQIARLKCVYLHWATAPASMWANRKIHNTRQQTHAHSHTHNLSIFALMANGAAAAASLRIYTNAASALSMSKLM